MKIDWCWAFCFSLLAISPCAAQQAEERSSVEVLEEIVVRETPLQVEVLSVDRQDLESGRYVNVGEIIAEMPGINAVRRGASATEPVIRGLGWERVSTQVGVLPLYGACPSRMDPPVTYIAPHSVQNVLVVKGIPSVTLGPFGTGGRIVVDPDYQRSASGEPELGGWAQVGADSVRRGLSAETGLEGGNEWLDFRGSFSALDYEDYESGDGKDVPADQREYSSAVSLGFRPEANHRWWNRFNYVREEDVDFPSLPMDNRKTDYFTANTGYRIDFEGGGLERFEAEFGWQTIDHLMNNAEKANRHTLEAETPSESDTYAGALKTWFTLAPNVSLAAGVDTFYLQRDATRTRFLVASGQTFKDHIWPDASQWNAGAFAEFHLDLIENLHLRVGGRLDRVESDAEGADDPGLGGRTVRENFVRFYGPEAADVTETEVLGAANVLMEWQVLPEILIYAGGGFSMRPAGVTERYFAFSPAPGGFLLGNPSLDAEKKYEIDCGLQWQRNGFDFSLSLFHFWFDDYILQTELARMDVNGDGTQDLVRGFQNVEARLYGVEASLIIKPAKHWSVPLSFYYTRGRNRSNDIDLPEIPPFEGRAALRFDHGEKHPWWCAFGGRFVAEQNDVDETFPEDETAAFNVFHLRGGVRIGRHLRLQVGIENLFDEDYNEHLTREVLLAAGDLVAGDEVPAPGRSYTFNLRFEF